MSLQSRSRTELVDQALEGQPAEVKARVLAIIIRYNIDVRNEFFLIFVAIGHLLAIVEESPENWRALFDDFKGELDEWTDANLRTLAAIHQQGLAQERMSQSFLKLTDSIVISNRRADGLQGDLTRLSRTLSGLDDRLGAISSGHQGLLSRFERVEGLLNKLQNRRDWILLINYGVTGLMVFVLSMLLWQQMKQGQRTTWLLQKAIREECWHGIKTPENPICQQMEW